MGKRITVLLGLAVGFVLFFGVNVLGNASLRGWRIDMTEEKLYTLSEGSKNIARSIDEPIHLKLYFSAKASAEDAIYKGYGQRVRELLEEYVHVADGGITLEVIDPEAYSEEEDQAVQAGLRAARSGLYEQIFLGLVASNAVGDREVVPFFSPSRERFLEYEVTRLVYALANPERRVVGLLTTLPLDGGMDPATGRPLGPRWVILDLIRSIFSIRNLAPGITEVPSDLDVLLVIHPKELPAETRYAIDQYVLGGGEAVVLIDPHCEADPGGLQQGPVMGSGGGPVHSLLPDLLAAWGAEMVPNRVAADRANALTIRLRTPDGRTEEWPWVAWHGVKSDGLDDGDPITSQLTQVNIPTPGILRPLPGARSTFHPLLLTSGDSMDLDVGTIQTDRPPQDVLSSFVPRMERYTLAARLGGEASTAFPDGPPGSPDSPDSGDTEGTGPPEGHLSETDNLNVVVFADCDFIADGFWLQQDLFGPVKMAENGDMLVNALENLSGGDDLISVRARGQFSRPFDRVEAIAQAAREEYLAEERELERKLAEAQKRVEEILAQTDENAVILPPEIVEERRRWEETRQETKRQLREVKHNMLADVERLGFWVKAFNIVAMPLAVALAAIAVWLYRMQLRRS